jgi:hypothetical protein
MNQSDTGEPQVDDQRDHADPDAPGSHIDDEGGPVPEPNEPA